MIRLDELSDLTHLIIADGFLEDAQFVIEIIETFMLAQTNGVQSRVRLRDRRDIFDMSRRLHDGSESRRYPVGVVRGWSRQLGRRRKR
ncbi:hypothetical protein D3C81_1946430 [compost metagenome]